MDPTIVCRDVRKIDGGVQVEMQYGRHVVRYRMIGNIEEFYVDGIATPSPYHLGRALGSDGSVEADMDLVELIRGKGRDCVTEANMGKKIAHPVWDLSNSDEGPVIVRKVPEQSERTKGSDLGWLNKNVATYIDGKPVMARVASVNGDGTYDIVTRDGERIAAVAEEFIDFLADRGGAESNAPSHKSADWGDNVNRRLQEQRQKNKKAPKPKFKKTTPTERWWNRLRKKDNPGSATPAQDVQSTVPVPKTEKAKEDLWSRLPVIDPNKTKKPKATDVGGGAKFDPNSPEVTGAKLRPFLENLKGSLDTHRQKYLQFLMDEIDEIEASGDEDLAEDKTRDMLIWLETQRINQKTLESIQYFLNETTPPSGEDFDVPVTPGKTPTPGSNPSTDISQPIVMQRGTGGQVAQDAQQYISDANGNYDQARAKVKSIIDEEQDDPQHVQYLEKILKRIDAIEARVPAQPKTTKTETGTEAPQVAPVAPAQQKKPPPTAPTGTTPPTKAPVAPATPVPPKSVQTNTNNTDWWEEMKKGGARTAQSKQLQDTYELTYILSILASLGYDVSNKENIKKILAFNTRHELASVMDRVPDEQWAGFVSTLGKPGAVGADLMQNRPRWWKGAPTPQPKSKEDKWREEWGLGSDAPYTPITPGKPPNDKVGPEPWEEPTSLEDWVYYGGGDEEDIEKQGQAQNTMLEWLYWMSEAGFPIDNYATMQHLAKLFPNNYGAQAAARTSEAQYKSLLQSGRIEEWAAPLRERNDILNPAPLPPTKTELDLQNKKEKERQLRQKAPAKPAEPGEAPPVVPGQRGQEPARTDKPVIMPGFQSGMTLKNSKGEAIKINTPGKRNSDKPQDFTVATAGMGVHCGVGAGRGFIVGAMPDGNLVVWLSKTKTNRIFAPNQLEQDSMRNTAGLMDLIRKVRAQVTVSGPDGQQQLQTNPNPGTAPRAQDGQPAAPGDMITPLPNSPTMTTPDNSGTITQVNPDGSIVYTNQQGEPSYNAPGEPGNIIKNPGGTTTV